MPESRTVVLRAAAQVGSTKQKQQTQAGAENDEGLQHAAAAGASKKLLLSAASPQENADGFIDRYNPGPASKRRPEPDYTTA